MRRRNQNNWRSIETNSSNGRREHKAIQSRRRRTYFKENSQKTLQNRNDLKVVSQITMENIKQILLKKDEAIQKLLMEINLYKCNNLQKFESKVPDSVENKETYEEMQGQAKHEWREASAPGFAAPDPSTGAEAPQE